LLCIGSNESTRESITLLISGLANNSEIEPTSQKPIKNKYFNYKMIRRGALIFFAITLIAFTILFLSKNSKDSLNALLNFKIEYLLLIFALVLFDWWIGSWRNHIFVRKVLDNPPQKICFKANLANIFMGAVTPSQTGGGPMHLYMLHRGGVNLTDGIALSVINFISSIILFISSAALALWYLKGTEINDSIYTLIKSGFTLFSGLFTIILVGIVAPSVLEKLLSFIGRQLNKLSKRQGEKINKAISAIINKLSEYNDTLRLYIRENPILLPYSLLITIVMYFNKFSIAYFICLGLDYHPEFWSIISIQAIIFFLLYFAPSPGGSGIAEFSIAGLMSQFIPELGIANFTILHRTFLLILPAIVGAIIVLKELKHHSEED